MGLLLSEAQFRDVFSWVKVVAVGEDVGCTTPCWSDKKVIEDVCKKKKDTTHIYVKDHKEVFIMCSILFKNKKFL